MKLQAVRMGFANNSSSSHSIVIGSILDEFGVNEEAEYGREEFLLKSKDSKRGYLASQIINGLKAFFSERVAILIAKQLLGEKIPENGSIDHQSCYQFPFEFGNSPRKPSLDFCEELTRYIMKSDDFHVAGGNDETRVEEQIYYGEQEPTVAKIPKDGGYYDNEGNLRDELVCRKDGDYWTLFNRDDGTKIRLSFDTEEPFKYASRPELVDLKITNYCPFGCKFCYQSSDTNGQHAKAYNVIRSLAEMEVFEIALGGGETTMHPEFATILRYGNKAGICMNFTTFHINWINDREIERAVIEHAKSFAISYGEGNNHDIKKIKTAGLWKRTVDFPGSISLQAILELLPDYHIGQIVGMVGDCGLENLTILGHKSWGRACKDKVDEKKAGKNLSKIINLCKEKKVKLAVDTVVVERYKDILDQEQIPDILRTDRDGNFSMYIDAVSETIAANSYGAKPIPIISEWGYPNLAATVAANFPFKV